MAELASNVGVTPRTIIVGATAVVRGVRVVNKEAAVVAGNTVRGDYVTAVDGAIGEPIAAYSMSDGGKVPALASEDVTAQDLAYSVATTGRFSKTSSSNVLVGKWTTTTASGKLGEVELLTVA